MNIQRSIPQTNYHNSQLFTRVRERRTLKKNYKPCIISIPSHIPFPLFRVQLCIPLPICRVRLSTRTDQRCYCFYSWCTFRKREINGNEISPPPILFFFLQSSVGVIIRILRHAREFCLSISIAHVGNDSAETQRHDIKLYAWDRFLFYFQLSFDAYTYISQPSLNHV